MNNINPPTKSIDIKTQEGLNLLKTKAEYYGYYAEHLKVLELIEEIEKLRLIKKANELSLSCAEELVSMMRK